jgi:uncharacterized protein
MNKNSSNIGFVVMIFIAIATIGILLILANTGSSVDTTNATEAPITNGKQEITVTVNETSYSPSMIKVKKGIPVDLKFIGKSYGCASALVSKDFWSGVKYVGFGDEQVISFTPQTTGTFRYSCSMGMYVGYIQVI